MIDLKYLEKNFEEASLKLKKKGVDSSTLDELKSRFQTLKEINGKLEQLKAKQNSLSKLFGVYKRENRDINELKTELNGNKEEISKLQESVNRKEKSF